MLPVEVGEDVDDSHQADERETSEGRDGETACKKMLYIPTGEVQINFFILLGRGGRKVRKGKLCNRGDRAPYENTTQKLIYYTD